MDDGDLGDIETLQYDYKEVSEKNKDQWLSYNTVTEVTDA